MHKVSSEMKGHLKRERENAATLIFHYYQILYYEIQSVCMSVLCVCMYVRNRLPNHAYYGEEAFAGDSVGLELGQRLNFISIKHIYGIFGVKSPMKKKILFERVQIEQVLCSNPL